MSVRRTALGDIVITRFETTNVDVLDPFADNMSLHTLTKFDVDGVLVEHITIKTPNAIEESQRLRLMTVNEMGKTWRTGKHEG